MPNVASKNNCGKRVLRLIGDLTGALRRKTRPPGTEPVLIRSEIPQTKSVHLVVIWDAWKDLAPKERSRVILNAWAVVRPLRGRTVTVAMGLTSEEALRMGFLPYVIISTRRKGDRVSMKDLLAAMFGAGGIKLAVGSSTQLRFASLEEAENAYRDLSRKVPGPYWAIVHEQSTTD